MTDREVIISWLRDYSIETWRRIAFTRSNSRGKIFEVTLTQNLVFQLYYQFRSRRLPFELWEARDEKSNGNDLEFAIETPRGYILAPCQAKIVKENLRYELNHTSAGNMQIESLIAYAKMHKAFPIYLLYNYSDDWKYNNNKWPNNYDELTSNGCSICSAQYLYEKYYHFDTKTGTHRWKTPTFQDLHPENALPLYLFVAILLQETILPFEQWRYYQLENDPHFYSYEELNILERWDNLTPLPRISGIEIKPEIDYVEVAFDDPVRPFNPRYRIIIPQKRRKTRILLVR
ncbi:hypothetical protein HNQ91_003499 [Filimonas zeae]|uniref:Uncharacterized protein n=1 Tax=Filimonas zeae TaxID=1737353 RepID=A0A917J1Q5_9BACT|nr:hypothetical protein [Filimonas zeae]MDR6340434.1 hypothetical protein [Filimonas zeae]GGH72717.1 hypothetical protein GCM10011379_33460 [Filimonas zeae]